LRWSCSSPSTTRSLTRCLRPDGEGACIPDAPSIA
jgi:hypothetical protein